MCVSHLLGSLSGTHMHSDPDGPENQICLPGDDQMPQSLASSQTAVGTSVGSNTGCSASFKRKRDISPSDCARNVRPFVAGSDGDSLPHYLTVSPVLLQLFSHIECECRFLKAGNPFCSKSKVCLTYLSKLTVTRQDYTWGVLWELVRIHHLDSDQGITPKACRSLMGKNAIVGPNVKAIILGTKSEENSIPNPGKAERDAQVRGFRLYFLFSGLMDTSLHGTTLILRSCCLMTILPF